MVKKNLKKKIYPYQHICHFFILLFYCFLIIIFIIQLKVSQLCASISTMWKNERHLFDKNSTINDFRFKFHHFNHSYQRYHWFNNLLFIINYIFLHNFKLYSAKDWYLIVISMDQLLHLDCAVVHKDHQMLLEDQL